MLSGGGLFRRMLHTAVHVYLALVWMASSANAQSTFTYGSTPWPVIPDPPRAAVQWVSDDMRINGIPMRIQSFDSKASKDEVVAFYKAHWARNASDTAQASITHVGEETLIAQLHGPFYLMAKVKEVKDGGSQGTLSISQIEGIKPEMDVTGIPVPPSGAKAVNVVDSIDAGKRNKQVIWITKGDVVSAAGQYHLNLAGGGWKLLQEQKSPSTAKETSIVRMYAKDQQQLDVVIGRDVQNKITIFNTNLVTFKP